MTKRMMQVLLALLLPVSVLAEPSAREKDEKAARAAARAQMEKAARAATEAQFAGLTPAIFSDHMVLQQKIEVPVWGTADPGGTVTVKFMNQTKTAKADDKGKWMVKLDKMDVVRQPQEMTVKDAKETRVFKDVLVGDVWLCSGQSNMEWGSDWSEAWKIRKNLKKEGEGPATTMGGKVDEQTKEVLKRAIGNPMLRVSSKTRDHLVTQNTGWEPVDEKNVITLAALAGCVAVHLQEELKIPIGIVVRSESGTALIEWISLNKFKADPLVKAAMDKHQQNTGKSAGPTENPGLKWNEYVMATVPYGIRGFLWDQGEWGVGFRGVDWTPAMHALITNWRKDWELGDLPWSATDRYKDSNLVENLKAQGVTGFMLAKRPPSRGGGLHPVNKEEYAQKHLDNIFPQVYGRPAPQWAAYPAKGNSAPKEAKPAEAKPEEEEKAK